MANSIRIIAGASIPHRRCINAPLLASSNGQAARSRCIDFGHATIVVEEADTFLAGQTVFARPSGTTVADHVEHIDHRAQTVAVLWNQDALTR